ncbi:probable Splicing factor 3b, subunit 2 [Ustilago sp. UG-2017b]|nr:probable Splicing factor 3b, subunit 2 [Ustilago sp. UG-2017b]
MATMATNALAGPSSANASKAPLTKNAKRRQKKKQQQQQQQAPQSSTSTPTWNNASTTTTTTTTTNGNHVLKQESYDRPSSSSSSIIDQAAEIRIDPDSEVYKAFSNVLSRYQPDRLSSLQQSSSHTKGEIIYSDDEIGSEHDSDSSSTAAAHRATRLSKRKQKKLERLTVAELKQLVRKPEVVEWTDVTSNDPRLLVHLKCTRNSVGIPPHWAQKRDYLQNKRGIEKRQYQLPSYVADTGIATVKDALKEKEAEQSLKQKTRERVQPKMGKMDIDYQKLYDAFFKFQSRPHLSPYGDIYYEGKEYETKYKDKRPGQLSKPLIEALSIPPLAPPPWLIAMQRYGPPPSYPHLQIPGLNAPIPEGAQWGFHPGGWGRPPVDEYGNSLYANVLANAAELTVDAELVDKVEKQHWGQLEPEQSDPEEQEQEQEQEEQQQDQEQQEPVDQSGLQSVASTVAAGLQTPSFIELRKDARVEGNKDAAPRSLYQVLPERAASSSASGQFIASERVYDLSCAKPHWHSNEPVLGSERTSERGTKRAADAIQVSIHPEDLHNRQGLAARYDQERKAKAQSRFEYASQDGERVAQVREQMTSERRREEEARAARRH